MKYEILVNDKCVTQTNDFRQALIGYQTQINSMQNLEMPEDFFDMSIELRMNEENKFMRTSFEMGDIE